MKDLTINYDVFENIKHKDEEGNEYWEARKLLIVLGYTEWRNFINVINKAKNSCKNSNNNAESHFVELNKMVAIGSNTKRKPSDYKLSKWKYYVYD